MAKGWAKVEFAEEAGGGPGFKRKRFLALMEEIGRREAKTLILVRRARLMRFGSEGFEHFGKINGCELLALNQKRLATATALPVTSPTGNGGAALGRVPCVAGKVTPVRREFGL